MEETNPSIVLEETSSNKWVEKTKNFWDRFSSQKLYTKIGLLIMLGVVLASPILIATQTNLFSHADNSGTTKVNTTSTSFDGYGIYESCKPENGQACYDRLNAISQGGFKVVLNYASLYGHASDLLAYADAAQAAGLKVIWTFNDRIIWKDNNPNNKFTTLAHDCGCNDSTKFAQYVVDLVKNHPATWGYYVGDELQTAEHDKLKAFSDVIHAADPNHPRLYVGDANAYPSAYAGTPYWDVAEVIADDYYPIGRPASHAPLNTAAYTATVAKKIQSLADAHSMGSAIVLQALSWADFPNDPFVSTWCSPASYPCPALHFPTASELLTMRDLAMTNMHPRLVLWYSYFDLLKTADASTHWNDLVHTIKTPIPTPPPSLTITPSCVGAISQVSFAWNSIPNATSYTVDWWGTINGKYNEYQVSAIKGTSILLPNAQYQISQQLPLDSTATTIGASGFPQDIKMGVSLKQQSPTVGEYSTPVLFTTAKCVGSSPTPSPTSPPTSGNIASNATVSVSSTLPPVGATTFVGDNAKDNNLTTEWASKDEFTPWTQLTWPNAQTITSVKLFDRPNTTDKIGSGYLTFSDGSVVRVGQLPDTGSEYEVKFTPKSGITWVKFQVTAGDGTAVGLSEFQVFGN